MANSEILRVNMDVDGGEGTGLLELLQKLKERFQKTGSAMAQTMSDMRTSAVSGLSGIAQLFKKIAYGREAKAATTVLRRTVMNFDELNRLAKKTGSSTGTSGKSASQVVSNAASVLDKVGKLGAAVKEKIIDPLKQIPELGLQAGLRNLGDGILSLLGITRDGNGVLQMYNANWDALNLKSNFWKDTVERTNALTGEFNTQMARCGLLTYDTAQSMGQLGLQLENGTQDFGSFQSASTRCWDNIRQAWSGSGSWFSQFVSDPVAQTFSALFSNIDQKAQSTNQSTRNIFSDLGSHFSQRFSKAWGDVSSAFGEGGQVFTQVEGGVLTGFKSMVNSLITGVNRVTAGPFNGLNTILNKLQNVKIGALKPFSFLSWRISVPQIPYLAQGAVLPANKPFMAVVGDQRHGTNIEAPLDTIVEAMCIAMEDYTQGNMAGHAATVDVLRQLLGAVMGISIGDATIAAACDRHHQKMAIVNGR